MAHQGIVYDAAPILGLGETSSELLPSPAPGEVVIRVDAWSLHDLRTCDTVVRHKLMWDQDWYAEHPFLHEKLIPGVYRLRPRIPDSARRNYNEQRELLLPREEVPPVALMAVALLCHQKQTGEDLVTNHFFVRCIEVLPMDCRVAIFVKMGRVNIDQAWDARRFDNVVLAGYRKV